MGKAKDLIIKPVSAKDAGALVRRVHYSGSIVQNSQIHLGVFLGGSMLGAMQFGPPMDRKKVLGLVQGSEWGSVIELNRMAFDDRLPRNSESRAMAVAFRMFRDKAPQVKWVLSFSDGAQCGDGAIYRAAGFRLTGIKRNNQIIEFPDGYRTTRAVLTGTAFTKRDRIAARYGVRLTGGASLGPFLEAGAKPVPGFQLRYIKFLDPAWEMRLTVPVIPFDQIPHEARMYRGERVQA